MGHLEGNFTPVLYIGRKVPKGYEGRVGFVENIRNTGRKQAFKKFL